MTVKHSLRRVGAQGQQLAGTAAGQVLESTGRVLGKELVGVRDVSCPSLIFQQERPQGAAWRCFWGRNDLGVTTAPKNGTVGRYGKR